VLPVTEQAASSYITQIRALAAALRKRGFRFAVEGFGSPAADPEGMLDSVPLDFVKIDGAIVQGLTGDPQLQQRVRTLVEALRNASSRRSPSVSRTPIRWRSYGRSACNTSRATSSTSRAGRIARRARLGSLSD